MANAITLATENMYDSDCLEPPAMLENTFKTLVEMDSNDVLISEMDGAFYRQKDGVAMGSPEAPLRTNIFWPNKMTNCDPIHFRYVVDVIRSLITGGKQTFLDSVNTCHCNLTITVEEPSLDGLPFLVFSMK